MHGQSILPTLPLIVESKDSAKPSPTENSGKKHGGTASKKHKPFHAIPCREQLEKGTWTRKVIEDGSRLPSMYHILFAILDKDEEKAFLEAVNSYNKTIKVKMVHNLGAFAVCSSEAEAEALFNKLESKFKTYPLKDVPKSIRNDQLRSEICFMEGVRPQKTTSVAERFIYKHLGFK